MSTQEALLIHCGAKPEPYEDMPVISHDERAKDFVWNPSKVKLFFPAAKVVRKYSHMTPYDATYEAGKVPNTRIMNGNDAAFLLANPECIPSDWQGFEVLFPKTRYHLRQDGQEGRVHHFTMIPTIKMYEGRWVGDSRADGAGFIGKDRIALQKL